MHWATTEAVATVFCQTFAPNQALSRRRLHFGILQSPAKRLFFLPLPAFFFYRGHTFEPLLNDETVIHRSRLATMLQKIARKKNEARGHQFAIIASSYNARYVDAMLRAAKTEILRAGAKLQVVRVPGAYEIPVVAARLARQARDSRKALSGIICLGVILRGATTHAAHIGEAVSNALAQIQIQHEVPVIHEVLLLENEQQAKERCLSRTHNRGAEAAQTALEMSRVMRSL
jgi:6,7-dimethyl-8-ribityllumazine synthase